MSKRKKSAEVASARPVDPKKPLVDANQPEGGWGLSSAVVRETIESVIVAFVLAFIFRTFEAEAFVIPTGSMAPTLMGKHKDLVCDKCGYGFQVSASDQKNPLTEEEKPAVVDEAVCPMCRHTMSIDDNKQGKSYPTYDGDRILVAKFPYEIADPKRWDVIVFKFPGNATMNYIKRLVGLPGETIRIEYGDLWIHTAKDKAGEFHIARKPPNKILAMLQPVYDNDYAKAINKMGWPARWSDSAGARGNWEAIEDGNAFRTKSDAAGENWIRYEHLTPSWTQWQEMMAAGHVAANDPVVPELISDFTGYNTGQEGSGPPTESSLGLHWVGDLALDFAIETQSASGEILVELVKGSSRFQCHIDLSTGNASLSIVGPKGAIGFHPVATTSIKGAGKHDVMFSNVDDELRLWVDKSLVKFDAPTTYDSTALNTHVPTRLDWQPAGIGASKAKVSVRHIKLMRDIYYIAESKDRKTRRINALEDFETNPSLSQADHWSEDFGPSNMRHVEFAMKQPDKAHPDLDQFFVLGDNSAASADGRLWADQCYVERNLLIGKALLIYWPHSWHKIPYTPIPFPFFPNFSRMHLVR